MTTCTAGFNVTNGSYAGPSTAAHCQNSQKYGSIQLTFRAEKTGANWDVQCHSTYADYVSDDFYYDRGRLRDTSTVGFANPGDRVCRFGKTTGAVCDYVQALNRCSGGRCGLTTTELDKAEGGDSGGPWYYGGTASGIHSGFTGDGQDACTPATRISSAFPGVSILLN